MTITAKEIKLLIKQEPRTLLRFYSYFVPRLKRFFGTKVADNRDAEELIQDTFLSILDSLPQYKGDAQFETWCLSIAKHELVDYYRRKKIKDLLFSRFPFLRQIVDKALGPQLALEEKETKNRIKQTMKNLSEGYELVLRLRYIEGMSVSDIAHHMNISYKAAESKLSRARLAFQKAYICDRSFTNTNT